VGHCSLTLKESASNGTLSYIRGRHRMRAIHASLFGDRLTLYTTHLHTNKPTKRRLFFANETSSRENERSPPWNWNGGRIGRNNCENSLTAINGKQLGPIQNCPNLHQTEFLADANEVNLGTIKYWLDALIRRQQLHNTEHDRRNETSVEDLGRIFLSECIRPSARIIFLANA
jgi:hypothetical protein